MLQLNLKDKVKSNNDVLAPNFGQRTQMLGLLRANGFVAKEISTWETICRMKDSDAFYVKLYPSQFSVCLWCTEDTYTVKRSKYPDNFDMTCSELMKLIFNNL